MRTGKTIYHFEGPKDVETARARLGVVATTSGSASSWRPEFRAHYTGANVVIIPDNDAPGRKYAATVAQDLLQVARSVKVVHLEGLAEGEDLTDWLEAGHTKEEFFAAVSETEGYGQVEEDPWPEPAAIEAKLPDVMGFDPSLLPGPLRAWVRDVSERMDNAPPDFAAAAVVAAASGDNLAAARAGFLVWMDAEEAAAYLNYPLGTFKALAGRGDIPRHKRGAGYRYKREELDQGLLLG